MSHNILLKLSYSPSPCLSPPPSPSLSPPPSPSPSPLQPQHNRSHTARILNFIALAVLVFQSLRITNRSSLAIEVSTEEVLVVLFACEIRNRLMFSKFHSLACESHGTTFYIYVCK